VSSATRVAESTAQQIESAFKRRTNFSKPVDKDPLARDARFLYRHMAHGHLQLCVVGRHRFAPRTLAMVATARSRSRLKGETQSGTALPPDLSLQNGKPSLAGRGDIVSATLGLTVNASFSLHKGHAHMNCVFVRAALAVALLGSAEGRPLFLRVSGIPGAD